MDTIDNDGAAATGGAGADTTELLYQALCVLTEDERHVARLREIDPKALEQAYRARYAHVTDMLRTRKPGLDALSEAMELEHLRACLRYLGADVPEPPAL